MIKVTVHSVTPPYEAWLVGWTHERGQDWGLVVTAHQDFPWPIRRQDIGIHLTAEQEL